MKTRTEDRTDDRSSVMKRTILSRKSRYQPSLWINLPSSLTRDAHSLQSRQLLHIRSRAVIAHVQLPS